VKSQPAVCFQGVSFGYGSEEVLSHVDFDILQSDNVCVVGPNGGGKTTLLKLVLGLLKPDSGRILVFGEPPDKMQGALGYVPQHLHFDPVFPVRALDVVLMGRVGRRSFGFSSREDRKRAEAALDQVGQAAQAQAQFSELSGGQRQAVLIARALVGSPRAILLDEPDAHIDPGRRDKLKQLLDFLPTDITRIIVSHNMDFVFSSVEKVICVHRHVHVHPTSELTAERIRSLFGSDLRLVRHDREHPSATGHHHPMVDAGKGGPH
jgi:zinc transport system ATP-binding protein